jgi:hypothetical protein
MKWLLQIHHQHARRRLVERLARRFMSRKKARALSSRIP